MEWHGSGHKQLRRDTQAALAAVVAHVLLVLVFVLMPTGPRGPARVETRQLSPGKYAANKAVRTPQQRAKLTELKQKLKEAREEAEQKKIEQELKDLTGQVVDLPQAPDNTPPIVAKFLSEFNNKVAKESKSRFRKQDYKRATNEPVKTAEQKPEAAQAPSDTPGKKGKAGEQKAEHAPMTPDQQRRERLALSLDKINGLFQNQGQQKQVRGQQGQEAPAEEGEQGENGNNGRPNAPVTKDFMPNLGVLSKIAGAPANDYLPEDVADGDGTFLNSKEFKFAPFFNRMKQSVSEHWRPIDELRRRDPTGNIYGYTGRVTVVSVVLNADGYLKNVHVSRSSGVDFIDREAIAAFEKAQPFLNPPKQLVKGGEIEFPFGFHIEFNSRFGF